MLRYITLDGHKYAVEQDSYQRNWVRQFNMTISAATIQINFVDRGPGVRSYILTLLIESWPSDSAIYSQDGIVESEATQRANLEASYNKIATPLAFTDVYGETLTKGVFFTKMVQVVHRASTSGKPITQYQIEVYEVGKETA